MSLCSCYLFWRLHEKNVKNNKTSRRRCSVRKVFLRNFTKFTGKHLCQSLFFNKVAGAACNFIKKETLAQVLSCKFCEISKNTFCTEHLWTTASGWFPEDFKAQNLGSKENEKLSFYLFTDILWIINTEKSCRHYYSSFSQSLPSTQAST